MKKLIHGLTMTLSIGCSALLSLNTHAQLNSEILPPIIDLILNESAGDNVAPINLLPFSSISSPIEVNASDGIAELDVSVDDINGNLASIEVTASRAGLLNPGSTTIADFQNTNQIGQPGFILSGSQAELQESISPIAYATLFQIGGGDVLVQLTVTSTDTFGQSDVDIIFINFIDDFVTIPNEPNEPNDPNDPNGPIDEIPPIGPNIP